MKTAQRKNSRRERNLVAALINLKSLGVNGNNLLIVNNSYNLCEHMIPHLLIQWIITADFAKHASSIH